MTTIEPNPPVRRDEDFPKTTTVPEQWVTDALMDAYNPTSPTRHDAPVPDTGGNGRARARACEGTREEFVATSAPLPDPAAHKPVTEESLFSRRLDPFPTRGEQHGAWL